MPPVFRPRSPSSARLWSWAVGKSLAVLPSHSACREISMPSSSSWMTMFAPAPPKVLLTSTSSMAWSACAMSRQIKHAFAERQAVGFDGATSAQRGGEARGGGEIGEGARARGRDAVLLHEPLREDLRGFELSGLLVRAPDAPAVLLPQIHDAQRQRIVRPDDREVGALLLREGTEPGQILRAEVDALDGRAVFRQAFPGDAGIARRAPHLRDVRATAPVSRPARARARRSR